MTIRGSIKPGGLHPRPSRRHGGFTLIELLVVVAILGILASIAYASYTNQVLKSRRAAAATCIMEGAQYMERVYASRMTYLNADFPTLGCATELQDHYTIEFAATPTAGAYSIKAEPKNNQVKDTKCGTLSLNQAGTRSATGSAGASGCW